MHTAPGMPQRGPMAPPMGAPQPQQPMVQGPVASYGGAQTPFQVAGAQPADAGGGGREASRTQSQRVYAVVLGVIFLMGIAITVAVWLRPGQDPVGAGPSTTGANDGAAVVTNEPPHRKKRERAADTGQPPAPAPAPKAAPRRSTTSSKPASKPAAAPKTPSGTLNVRLKSDHAGITAVMVQCSGTSYRQRKALSNGMAVFSGVPSSSCKLVFQGTSAATFNGVSGGMSVSCSITGTQAICT